jgi:hypothetical protein
VTECRKNGTTVTGAIMASLITAFSEVLGDNNKHNNNEGEHTTIQVGCGADSRAFYKQEIDAVHLGFHVGGVGHYSQVISTQLQCCDAPTSTAFLWDTARNFRQSVKASIKQHDVLTIGSLMGLVYDGDFKQPKFKNKGGTPLLQCRIGVNCHPILTMVVMVVP